jgi:hypothetical protein
MLSFEPGHQLMATSTKILSAAPNWDVERRASKPTSAAPDPDARRRSRQPEEPLEPRPDHCERSVQPGCRAPCRAPIAGKPTERPPTGMENEAPNQDIE